MDRDTFVVFVEDTQRVPLDVLHLACRRLGATSKWFPTVSEVLEESQLVALRLWNEKEMQRRALTEAPATPEQMADLKRRIQAAIAARKVR